MNIFALDTDPILAAKFHNDRHVVKMVLESAQLLSTAHRLLDGQQTIVERQTKSGKTRKVKVWKLDDSREYALYQATHINHPSAVWARQNRANYRWLFRLFRALLQEYTDRYGKVHKCDAMLSTLVSPPAAIPAGDVITPFALAMPDECKVIGDPVKSYRQYYMVSKRSMAVWNRGKSPPPEWWV